MGTQRTRRKNASKRAARRVFAALNAKMRELHEAAWTPEAQELEAMRNEEERQRVHEQWEAAVERSKKAFERQHRFLLLKHIGEVQTGDHEVDERHQHELKSDVLSELSAFGKINKAELVLNQAPHLRGHLYIEFQHPKQALLVPVLRAVGARVVLFQTRGTDFVTACRSAHGRYEADTIDRSGAVHTDVHELQAVGSLGDGSDRAAFLELPAKLPQLQYIGLGVTESGLCANSPVIRDLAAFLWRAMQALPNNKLSVINTDNVPNNGALIKRLVLDAEWAGKPAAGSAELVSFRSFLDTNVVFHNTMVDRITSHRSGDALVPSSEPSPAKALVVEDLQGVLPGSWKSQPGVVVRSSPGQLEQDLLLKLRIANAVHTALVYVMSLSRLKSTVAISQHPELNTYVDTLFAKDILPSLEASGVSPEAAQATFNEWKARLAHPHFGVDTFWVAQNAMFKLSVRLLPRLAVRASRPSACLAFATAAVLRYLTPTQDDARREDGATRRVFVGQMDALQAPEPLYAHADDATWSYATGLSANISTGKYEFVDGEQGRVAEMLRRVAVQVMASNKSSSNTAVRPADASSSSELAATVGVTVATALSTMDGFDLTNSTHAAFAADVAALYQRLLEGKSTLGATAMDVLRDVLRELNVSEYLTTREQLATFVRESVATVSVIDVHTHLFPPTHGKLMLWGINELLTYHYLVAEYMITAPMEIEEFNTLSKEEQAALIWQHLFIDRSPVSEACRGVITTLTALGLGDLVAQRDLRGIQQWFAKQDPDEYVDTVFRLAGLQYVVMTNIPFEPEEARHWLGDPAKGTPPPKWSRKYFRSALRVDQVLLGDWASMAPALDVFGMPHTLDGCRAYLEKWIEIMQPEYFMSSVPIHFRYPDKSELLNASPTGERPSGAELLLKVLLPLAEARNLPIALKFDSVRPINARLGVAGDGVKPSDVDILIKLCREFPKVKFLATFLSRVNQHEVTVAANKFRNLHLYGCWWYCNNPSIIDEMTRQRIEILGTAFTSQHSDARVLDQLIYKWKHSREIIGDILVDMYDRLMVAGWRLSKDDVRRDVYRLFGGSYEDYMAKAS
ncbi:hypothetical protein P43SY_002183 [Pythium insidiosum]|uniref:Mannitol dehydrogenase N-terminal domain-containing protein n=1 Tax=Pythium insidiosum TaxID=114742 RepID=A0AAD5Q5Q9_PYTIN|nr:hypothetical protein P43SY_002183 [Pythium insidiosum]